MTDYSRRSHIIRVPLDDPPADAGSKTPPTNYADIEILDAISFQLPNGKEVVLNMDQAKAVPYIVDNTGGAHGKTPSEPTQRTHMKRVVNPSDPTQKLDIEVIDVIAFDDLNGGEWILDMQPGAEENAIYNISDGSGNSDATRRVHNEILSFPFGKTKADADKAYITVQRDDAISFLRTNAEETVLSCPSCDDTKTSNTNFGRASTYVISPKDYDPSNESPDAVVPPLLLASKDQHVYLAPVKGASGILTGDAKIAQGPLWWIRKVVSGGSDLLVIAYRFSQTCGPGEALPSFAFTKFAFDSDTYDVLTLDQAPITRGNSPMEKANPPSAAFMAANYMWTEQAPNVTVTPQSFDGLSYQTVEVYGELVFNISTIKKKLAPDAKTMTISATVKNPDAQYIIGPSQPRDFANVYGPAFSDQDAIDKFVAQEEAKNPTWGGAIEIFATKQKTDPNDLYYYVYGKYNYIPHQATGVFFVATAYTYRAKNIDKKQPFYSTNGYPDYNKGVLDGPHPNDQIQGFLAPLDKWTGTSDQVIWSDPAPTDAIYHPGEPYYFDQQTSQPPGGFSWTIDLKTYLFTGPDADFNPREKTIYPPGQESSFQPTNPAEPTP